jgi:TRAP-type mannitol/chloroaromatic compound transport system permease large subunit
MTSGYLGLLMLGLIVAAIMMGFPTAFTLMGLGMVFGFIAYFDADQAMLANKVFDLMVQRTYGGMTNDTLLSIPLFVLMGYVIERAALVDRMFHAVQLSFRRLPASLAVATLVVCTFWGIASGIVGAVVVLMGVIAMRPMLKAGYDVRLASGVIAAGGTLGILIPPSVMIIVYAAVAGQSVVKLYAAAMVPGFFLAFLYFVYIVGWAVIDPKVAPRLPESELQVDVPPWLARLTALHGGNALVAVLRGLVSPGRLRAAMGEDAPSTRRLLGALAVGLGPLLMVVSTFALAWWYVVIHNGASPNQPEPVSAVSAAGVAEPRAAGVAEPPSPTAPGLAEPPGSGSAPSGLSEPPGAAAPGLAEPSGAAPAPSGLAEPPGSAPDASAPASGPAPLTLPPAADAAPAGSNVPESFGAWFWGLAVLSAVGLIWYYRQFSAQLLEVQRLLFESVMPLALLTGLVLVVILFGITTATESAAVGAAGAFLLAWRSGQLTFAKTREAVYLTAKTTAMVCWLFVGSALFSAVFALHGGQELIERWILALDLSPLQFLMLSQAIIFLLGWPLEWTEIIVIFVPIFLPMLAHFQIDPVLFGTLVAVNLQAAFLSPPVAMSAFYLKGVAPPHVTLNQIFAGMMPYMFIVIVCMALMYAFPGMTLWLPNFLYGSGG